MNTSFASLCATIVVCTLVMSYVLAPVLWDAVSHVEFVLNNIYEPRNTHP